MINFREISLSCTMAFWLMMGMLFFACRKEAPTEPDNTFLERQNAAHDGDYFATYPLSDADSCIARLKAEVPASLQPYGCLSIWYRMPRTKPEVNFRLLELYDENYPHDTVFAFTQMVRGEFYVDLAQFDSARICIEDAYERYTRLGRPLDASDATYLMARSYVYQNNFAEALKCYFEVLDLLDAQDTTFSHRRASLYRDIAVAYERSNNRPQYLSWLLKNWDADYSQLDNAWRYRAKTASGLSVYYLKENPDSSLYWVNLALDIFKQNNETAAPPARLIYWMARAYFMKGDCATALPYFLDAYRRNPDKSSLFGYYQFGLALGDCYLCTGQLDSAAYFLTESLASPDTGNLAKTHQLLSQVYAKKGEWEEALAAANESRRLYEAKFNADKAQAVADFEARYESAQKEHRIAELEEKQKIARQRHLIVTLASLLASVMILSLFFRQRGLRRILEQDKKLLEQDKKLAEAQAKLKAQELEQTKSDLYHSLTSHQNTQQKLRETSRLLELKNSLIEELEMKLTHQPPPTAKRAKLNTNKKQPFKSMKILTESDWVRFRQRFDEVFPEYLNNLIRFKPSLTAAELRLFLLLKLGFDKTEIAGTLGISVESVQRSRRRLRNKLGLADSRELDGFIEKYFE